MSTLTDFSVGYDFYYKLQGARLSASFSSPTLFQSWGPVANGSTGYDFPVLALLTALNMIYCQAGLMEFFK
jgi:hypothetical protein